MSTTTATPSTELIKTEEVTSVMATASKVLEANQSLLGKAKTKALTLIDTAAAGMSDELDAELNKWQVSGKDALKILNERRSPITQMMTQVTKVFTGMENELKGFNEQIQKLRDGWAAEKVKKQREEEERIRKEQASKNERIEIASNIEKQLRGAFQEYLFKMKSNLNAALEKLNLENFDQGVEWINNVSIVFKQDKWDQFKPVVNAIYTPAEEVQKIIADVKEKLFTEVAADYRENIEVDKQMVIDKIPSKKQELEAIAKADAAEAARLKELAAQREKLEQERIQKEAAEAKAREEQKVNTATEAAKVETLFDAHAQLAGVESAGKVREGFNIEVKNYAGWLQIVAFWFEREGKTLALDKFDKKTLAQMKTFAEKAALKDDKERIDSTHLVYHEVFKAGITKA